MDIVEKLRADAEYTDDIGLSADAAYEIERLRGPGELWADYRITAIVQISIP